jgi:hypothetical protein
MERRPSRRVLPRVRQAAGLAVAAGLGLGACGGEAPAEPDSGARLEAVGWHLEEEPAGRSVPLVYTTEECVRTPGEDTAAETAARFERADVASSMEALTITVLLRPPEDDGSGAGQVACGTAPVAVRRTVRLPDPLGERILKDGSTSPPTIVRPPG